MRKTLSILAIASCLIGSAAFAQGDEKAEGPCKTIKEACEKAGFVKGQAKEGTGLWKDCVDPIMQGKAQPAKAKKPLPTVDAKAVAECKAKRPNFGEGKKGK